MQDFLHQPSLSVPAAGAAINAAGRNPGVPGLAEILSKNGLAEILSKKYPTKGPRCTQRTQYPLIKEYTLNHNNKAPII